MNFFTANSHLANFYTWSCGISEENILEFDPALRPRRWLHSNIGQTVYRRCFAWEHGKASAYVSIWCSTVVHVTFRIWQTVSCHPTSFSTMLYQSVRCVALYYDVECFSDSSLSRETLTSTGLFVRLFLNHLLSSAAHNTRHYTTLHCTCIDGFEYPLRCH